MDLLSTIKGSNMENYFPKGWDLKKIDDCCSHQPMGTGVIHADLAR